jgi:hypothetical protein
VPAFGMSPKIYNRMGDGVPANQNLETFVFRVLAIKTVG